MFSAPRGKELTGEGEFTLTIPEGYIIFADGSVSPAIDYKVTVGEAKPEMEWTADPKDGSTVADAKNFKITFPGVSKVTIADNAEYTATFTKGSTAEDAAQSLAASVSGNVVTFSEPKGTMSNVITGEGTLVVTFPAGTFLLDGKPSAEFTYTLIQDPQSISNASFIDFVTASDPQANGFVFDYMMNFFAFSINGDVSVNQEVTDAVTLAFNGNKIASADSKSISAEDSMVYIDFSEVEPEEDGVYTVTIPDNLFIIDGNPVKGSTITFLRGVGTFTPAAGSEIDCSVNPWSSFKLTPFSGVEPYELYDETKGESIFGTEEPAVVTLNGDKVAEFDLRTLNFYKGVATFEFQKAIEENGTYTVTFPENFFCYTVNGKTTGSGEFSIEYTVTGADQKVPDQTYTLSPEAGKYEVFPTITLTYDNYEVGAITEGAQAYLTVGTGSTVKVLFFDITADGKSVVLTPTEDYKKWASSEYTSMNVTVPADSYKLLYDGKAYANTEVKISDYKIAIPSAPAVVANPESGSTLSALPTIVCTVGEKINSMSISKKAKLYLVNADGSRSESLGNFKAAKNSDNTSFTLTPPTVENLADGNYVVVLQAELYQCYINGSTLKSAEQELFYTIDKTSVGIDGVAGDETVTVYTITGACVLRDAPAAEVANLDKGLYIINGRKVVVK